MPPCACWFSMLGHILSSWNLLCSVHKIQSCLPKQFSTIFGHDLTMTFYFESQVSEMLNTIPTSFFDSHSFIPKKCSSYLVHLNGVIDPELLLCPYLVMWWTQHWTFGPQIMRNALHYPNNSFSMTKVVTTFKWKDGSETVISPIFDHVMNLAFHIWNSNF